MELYVALKMLCLAPPPLCKCYKGACDNQTRDDHDVTLMMMMMTMSDSGSTYYNCFCDMFSSLKSYQIFVVKPHVGSIVVSLI